MIADYCACGAGIRLVGGDDETNTALLAQWQAAHVGRPHASVTAAEASAIRHGGALARGVREAARG